MPARTPMALTLAVALGIAVLGGCGSGNEPGKADPSPSSAPASETTPAPTDSPTDTASPSTSAMSSGSVTSSPAAEPEAALLDSTEMPQLNDTLTWSTSQSGSISSDPFGVCQRFDLLTIGAERGVQRLFAAKGPGTSSSDSAGQQVVDFPDAKNALRGRKVLEGLHRDCVRNVRGRQVKVSDLQAVPVSGGTGWWYLVSWIQGRQGHFESFGIALKGARMSLVRVDHLGQDHDYPPGEDPGELAVKAAAQKLG